MMAQPNLSRVPAAEERMGADDPHRDAEAFEATIRQLLTQPLDPQLVARRKSAKGKVVRYLEGYQVINQANRIFGHGRWGAEVIGSVGCRELTRIDKETGEVQPVVMYWATVRVRVAGCASRSDVGCGVTADDSPEAHDTAIKAAVTDAMKRALRQYGRQFGNALYERTDAGQQAAAKELTELRKAVLTLGGQLGFDAATTQERVARKAGKPLADLDSGELARVLRAMAEALSRNPRAA